MAWEYDPKNMALEEADCEEQRVAHNLLSTVIVHPGRSKMHMRRAIKKAGSPNAYEVEWLAASLNGVNCFVHEDEGQVTIVLTERDLKP